jgi:hypothetical protein
MKVILETVDGSISKSKAKLLPICETVKIGKFPVFKYGLASFGHFDYTGALKDTEYRIEVKPTYDIIIGDVYESDDIVVLGNLCEKTQNGSFSGIKSIVSDSPKCYKFIYHLFQSGSGVFSKKLQRHYNGWVGEYCITDFALSDDRKAISVMTSDGEWGAINWKQDIIVPQGKYRWVDFFKEGLARVKGGKETNGNRFADTQWGLVDIEGNEIIPPIYSNMQLMDDKVYLEQGSKKSIILLKDLEYETYESVKERELREKAIRRDNLYNKPAYDPYDKYDYNKTAREQISDAYDGESDALWNTD